MIRQTILAAALVAGAAVPAAAQVNTGGGLVAVTVTDVSVLNDSLNKNQVAALNNIAVPVTVQVPIGIAANVCGTTVALLSAAGSKAECTATNASGALGQAIVKQKGTQKKK